MTLSSVINNKGRWRLIDTSPLCSGAPRALSLSRGEMAFWKKKQVPIEHLPVHNISDVRETARRLYGLQGNVSALMVHLAVDKRDERPMTMRYRLEKAIEADGLSQYVSQNPRELCIRVNGNLDAHILEWLEWMSPEGTPPRVPVRVTASLGGHDIPFAWTIVAAGTRVRMGLPSGFAIPLVHMYFMNPLVIYLAFEEPLVSGFVGDITVQAAWLRRPFDQGKKQIIPLHPGNSSRAPVSQYPGVSNADSWSYPPEFIAVNDSCMGLRTFGAAARWVGQLDRFALTVQHRFRKRRVSRFVYNWTSLPLELCQIVGTLASAGEEPIATNVSVEPEVAPFSVPTVNVEDTFV